MSLLSLLVVCGGLWGKVIVIDPEGIPQTTELVMTCIRTGDWEALKLLVSGNPDVEPVTGEEDSAEKLIWMAFQDSLQWSCEEPFAVRGAYIVQRVTVNCLDISKLAGKISQSLQESKIECKESEHMRSVVDQVLKSDLPTVQREITLTYIRQNGRWQVIPDGALLYLLSGLTVS